jgi:hypothetical protein
MKPCDGKCAYSEAICGEAGECQREKAYALIASLWAIVRTKAAARELICPLTDLKDIAKDFARDDGFRKGRQ